MASESVLAKMAVLISANTAQFSQALAASNKQLSSFGDAVKTANNLLATFGIGFGALQVFNGIKAGVGIMADFEHTMSEVKAITGTTGKEFEALEKDALRLGASTKFTATQVGQLQVAYGRLGFTTKEILAATEATLDLAAATGEDLAKSADVAGSTVRGFGLDASETQRVVDVMASSFNKTALGLENFTESMKYVAPIANAANVSVEETTALLGVLADSGIRGSQAGTALRKIFGDLSKDGRPVQERLKELGNKGISLADSFDEVGRTAQTALLVLTKNTEKTDQLTSAFQNASGEASKMARIMADDLTGDVTKLTSAWEGLILSLSDTSVFRTVTQSITGILNAISGNNTETGVLFKNLADAAKNAAYEIEPFKKELLEIRKEAGKPFDQSFISELIEKYNLTGAAADRFRKAVEDINKNVSFQEQALQQFNEFAKRNGYEDLSKGAEDYIESLNKTIIALTNQQQAQKQQDQDFNTNLFENSNKDLQAQIDSYLRVIEIIGEYKKTTSSITPPADLVETKGLIEDIEEKIKITEHAIKKAFTVPQIRQLENELKGLKDQLTLLVTPDVSRPKNFLDDQIEEISKGIKPIELPAPSTEGFEEAVKGFRERVSSSFQEIKGTLLEIDLSGLVSNVVSDLAFGLGQAAAGIGNFGDVILKALVGFAKQFGEILIGLGVAALAAKKLSIAPQAAIIAGVALVALAGVASAALNKGQANYNSGSAGGSIASPRAGRSVGSSSSDFQDQTLKVEVSGILRGHDIYLSGSNYQKNNGFLKPNG